MKKSPTLTDMNIYKFSPNILSWNICVSTIAWINLSGIGIPIKLPFYLLGRTE